MRIRDSEFIEGEWLGQCITCDKRIAVLDRAGKWCKGANLGHYIGRGNHELRYSELNCNLQCAPCNAWADKVTMVRRYRKALELKYGDGTAEELETAPERYSSRKADLLQVIHDSSVQLQFYLTNN